MTNRTIWVLAILVCLCGILGGCASEPASGDTGHSETAAATPGSKSGDDSGVKIGSIRSAKPVPRRGAPKSDSTARTAKPAIADENTTEPTVLAFGRITTADGEPASSVTVSMKGTSLDDLRAGKMATKALDETVTDGEGHYELRGPVLFSNVIEVSGDVPDMMAVLDRSKLYPAGSQKPKPGLTRIEQDFELLQGYKVSGQVVNEAGEPMPGLPVHVRAKLQGVKENRSLKTHETTSTAAGTFDLKNLPAGEWLIGTAHPDYAPVVDTITVPTTGPVTLRLAARGGTITGHVIHKVSGASAANVELSLMTHGNNQLMSLGTIDFAQTKSAADGSFRFDHVSSGTKFLNMLPNKDAKLGIAPPKPAQLQLNEGETTDVTVYVYPGHTISGRVFDKDTGDALAGVKISGGTAFLSEASETTSDADGNYKLENVFSNSYSGGRNIVALSAELEGYAPETTGYNSSVQVNLPDDSIEATKDLPMVKKLMIRGIVVTSTDKPIPHATVSAYNSRNYSRDPQKAHVNPDGTFEVETLPFVQDVLEAEAEGYGPKVSDQIEVAAQDVEGIKIVMEPGGTVEGRVLDPKGKPISGAEISQNKRYGMFSTYKQAAISGENGVYILNDTAEKLELKAKLEGYADSEKLDVSLAPGETRTGVDISLREGLKIAGRVLDANHNPVSGGSITFQNNAAGIYESANTDKDGKFEADGLAEGAYEITVFSSPNKIVSGVKTGTTDLEIILDGKRDLDATNKLIGTVVDDATSKPISNFEVEDYEDQITKLKEPGKFQFTGIRDRTAYNLTISSPGFETQKFSTKTGSGGETIQQEFRLGKSGAIVGRLVEAGSGKPMPGITVVNWGSSEGYERRYYAPKSHTISDESGSFVLAPAPTGTNYVEIKPPAPFSEKNVTAQVHSEQTEDLGDIQLTNGGTINGIVVRGPDEDPVADASIRLNGWADGVQLDKNTKSDREGKFTFEALPAMNYSVSAGQISKSVNLKVEETVQVKLLYGGVKISGTVTRGGALVQSSVSASGPDDQRISTYAQNGEYEIENVMPGSYKFSVYPQDGTGGRVQMEEVVEVPDQPEFVKDFELPNGAIEVTVTNAAGEPVQGAVVSLTQKSSNTGFDQTWLARTTENENTDSSGKASFKGLKRGSYGVNARKEGVGTAMKPDVQVNDSGAAQVQLQLSTEGGTLVSVALSYATGQGIPEAWCYLHGPNGPFTHSAKRGADGVMTIENIPPGTYTTNVSYWSHSQSEKTVEIKANETVKIEDVLYPAGAIHWTLKKADGSPAAGANVTVTPINTDPPEETRTGRAADNGQFIQRGLAAGTYQVTAQLNGKPAVTETISVAAGQNVGKSTTAPGW